MQRAFFRFGGRGEASVLRGGIPVFLGLSGILANLGPFLPPLTGLTRGTPLHRYLSERNGVWRGDSSDKHLIQLLICSKLTINITLFTIDEASTNKILS